MTKKSAITGDSQQKGLVTSNCFFPGDRSQIFTHSLLGVLLFCLPIGMGLLWSFHAFLKHPLLRLLPALQQMKLKSHSGSFPFLPWQRLLFLALATMLGALTHLIWDSFTHGTGWSVQTFAWLRQEIFVFLGIGVKPYHLVKHGSSTLGVLLLGYWYWQWLWQVDEATVRSQPTAHRIWRNFVLVSFFVTITIGGMGTGLLAYRVGYELVSTFIRRAMVALLMLLVVAAVVWQYRQRFESK